MITAQKILRSALIILISALPFSANADLLKEKCTEWLNYRNELNRYESRNLTNDEYTIKNKLLIEEYKKRSEYLKELGMQYLNGNIPHYNIDQDFKTFSNYQKIMSQFSVALLQLSIEKLQHSKIPSIQKMMAQYNTIYTGEAIPLFRITGSEIQRESPTEEKGGFHRGKSSIFMDITRTSNNEWLFIFSHELFHALDSKLYEASSYFSAQNNFNEIMLLTMNYKNLVELNNSQNAKLDQWVLAGLNRGLFAEFRAWTFGLSIYSEGIEEKLWGNIPFVNNVMSFKDPNENMNSFIYRYLNERAKISKDGFLNKKIIKEKIQEQRDQFDPTKA
jgi:hypothetical protein